MWAMDVLLFIGLWTAMMAIPLKLGLLPTAAARIDRGLLRASELAAPIWLRLLPHAKRRQLRADLAFRRTFAEIAEREFPADEPPTRWTNEQEQQLLPRPATRIRHLQRRLVMLALGSYAHDVTATIRLARNHLAAGEVDEAREQLIALHVRITVQNFPLPEQQAYYPMGRLSGPIEIVAKPLACGLDGKLLPWPTLEQGEAAVLAAFCEEWLAAYGDAAAAVADYVERRVADRINRPAPSPR